MSAQISQELVYNFADTTTASTEIHDLGFGRFGAIIVATGSDLIGKTLQFVAVSRKTNFAAVNMLATPITLAAGVNTLSSTVAAEVAAAGLCQMVVNSAVDGDESLTLLWKS